MNHKTKDRLRLKKLIERDLSTRPKWSKADYQEFYERDVCEVLLPLVKSLVNQRGGVK